MTRPGLTASSWRMVFKMNPFVPSLLTRIHSNFRNRKVFNNINHYLKNTWRFHGFCTSSKAQCPYKQYSLGQEGKIGMDNNFPGPDSIVSNEITKEIHFYRDTNNNFTETTYIDMDAPYGPPLSILLLWLNPDESILRRLIGIYGSKGFDVATVKLRKDQLLHPRREGGAIKTIVNFMDYLNGTHRYRPYIVHGFSTGVYIFGEMMAQLSEQYDSYYALAGNIKGCLWDSPIEFHTVAPVAAKALYPRNIVKRWLFERAISQHLSEHHRSSLFCWERSRDYFCRQKCKVPNLFFVSEKDPLSNPVTIEAVRTIMEQNGIPTYQKTWHDSKHLEHFTKHFDEYTHGMNLFFSLANLFPDPTGKFLSYSTNTHLTSIRLGKKAREVR